MVPPHPKLYHILHIDKLPSVIEAGRLWCDAEVARRNLAGTTIGMNKIKERRLTELTLTSYPDLHVGECVPFYFCPRSVMLYLMHQANHPELAYRGGQEPIIHFEVDLNASVQWAERKGRRWAFTLSNAGSYIFEDRCRLANLDEIDWDAVRARYWGACRDRKQAEFLIERSFPWHLVERIGVYSDKQYRLAVNALPEDGHRPKVEVVREWYY
jgi:hypothetical protein